MVELWRAGGPVSGASAELAQQVEANGWDGQMFMDSQSLSADPFVLMGGWALATERLMLSPGVTNPMTRHPAVTAACAVTLQAMTGGRAVLGIGRGDSALAYLGYAPVRLEVFERTLRTLQTLLSGGKVEFGPRGANDDARSLDSMSLADRPEAAGLEWLPPDLPKVPLDVAATGPKVIEMAATLAERVTLSVGAIPERLTWAMDLARAARRRAGLPDDGVSYGAQIVVVCHANLDVAIERAKAVVAPLARFQVIQGQPAGPISVSDEANFAAVRKGYDMTRHAHGDGGLKVVGGGITPDFVERFAVVGPPDRCIERLLQLHALGMRRFVAVGPGLGSGARPRGPNLFEAEVMPVFREAVGQS